jgi:lipopolysaccharide export system protein LptA
MGIASSLFLFVAMRFTAVGTAFGKKGWLFTNATITSCSIYTSISNQVTSFNGETVAGDSWMRRVVQKVDNTSSKRSLLKRLLIGTAFG